MKTIEDYRYMMKHFNKMSFKNKIRYIQKHKDVLAIASDSGWFGVRVKDKEIHDILTENEEEFSIKNEWYTDEIYTLISILGIDNIDL